MNPGATRERLLRAAWQVVRDEGLGAATSRRITDQARANLQAITYHFGSKDALLGEALVVQLQAWTEPLLGAVASAPGDPDRDATVARVVATTLIRFSQQGDDVRGILRALMSDHELPGVREAFTRWLNDFRQVVIHSMTTQQHAGLIPDDTDVHALAGVFTALGLGVIAQSELDAGAPPTPDLVVEFLRLLVRPGN